MVLQKMSGLPTTTPEIKARIEQELSAFGAYLEDRFGGGLSTPEKRIVEAYIVWKVLHEVPQAPSE